MAPSPYAGRSDADLLWSTAADPEAFGAFYDRYEEPLLAFFVRATGRGELAVDLAAETFAAALEFVGGFRPSLGSAKGWLFGIARHLLADAWRRGAVEDSARRRLGMPPLALEDEAFEAIERLAGRGEPDALALLGRLPPAQREAVSARARRTRLRRARARAAVLAERRAPARQPRPAHAARANRGRLVKSPAGNHAPELRRALVVAAARASAAETAAGVAPARTATARAPYDSPCPARPAAAGRARARAAERRRRARRQRSDPDRRARQAAAASATSRPPIVSAARVRARSSAGSRPPPRTSRGRCSPRPCARG
jgi:DNA-directed RNA polymerase specialized sigma24 family protein